MGSISVEIRTKQKESVRAALDARRATLAERGLDEAAIEKDPKYRAIAAEHRQAVRCLRAIDARAAHVTDVAGRKDSVRIKKSKGKGKGKGKADGGKKAKKAKKK
jgi:hypothetical protein